MAVKEYIDICKHENIRELRPKIYDYNMNPPEHLYIRIEYRLCLDCGDKIKSKPFIKNIISYCDRNNTELCLDRQAIIVDGTNHEGTEICKHCYTEEELNKL